jgi:hypothetical protein
MITEEQAIEKFLTDIDPIETARLAAMMAPPQKVSSAIALAEVALELQDAVAEAIKRRREELIGSMGVRNLYMMKDSISGSTYSEKEKAIIFEHQEAISSYLGLFDDPEIQSQLSTIQAELGPIELYPWNLEVALLYVTREKKTRIPAIKNAFGDFLKLQESFDFMGRTPSFYSVPVEIKDYYENFSPGKKAPKSLPAGKWETSLEFWEKPTQIFPENAIVWLAREFRLFWKKHKASYRKIHTAAEKVTKAKSQTRNHNEWIKRTESFITYLNEDLQRWESAKIPESIKGFIQESGLKDPRTHEKILIFFGTLLNILSAPSSSIRRQLRYKLPKNNPSGEDLIDKPPATYKELSGVSDSTITECLSLIKAAKPELLKKK